MICPYCLKIINNDLINVIDIKNLNPEELTHTAFYKDDNNDYRHFCEDERESKIIPPKYYKEVIEKKQLPLIINLLGAKGSGKSTYLWSIMKYFNNDARLFGFTPFGDYSEKIYESITVDALKTLSSTNKLEPLIFSLFREKKRKYFIIIDIPGEFATDDFKKFKDYIKYIKKTKYLWIFIDLFENNNNLYQNILRNIDNNLIEGCKNLTAFIILTKFDKIKKEENEHINLPKYLIDRFPKEKYDESIISKRYIEDKIISFSDDFNEELGFSLIGQFKGLFKNIYYIPISSTGADTVDNKILTFNPRRILDPLLLQVYIDNRNTWFKDLFNFKKDTIWY